MQQFPDSYPHSWPSFIWWAIASFAAGGGIAGLVTVYLNRRKPTAEVRKIEAETESLELGYDAARFDLVDRMMGRLDEAHDSIERLRRERNGLRDLTEKQRIELEMADYQLKRMSAFIQLKGLHYSDADRDKP
jgi:hypothetical protein